MKLLAFIEGRPMPQPRTTVKSKFLFSKTYEQWLHIDSENKSKEEQGLINKLGKHYKSTRYAYRFKRLNLINEYRRNIYNEVCKAVNNGVVVPECDKIPKNNLFVFYLFKIPTRWKKSDKINAAWTIHKFKPDTKNCWTAIEDALYKNDSDCSNYAHYKLYIPVGFKEGILILHNEEIHNHIIDITKDIICSINKQNEGM